MKLLGEGEKRLTNGFGILEDLEDIPIDELMAIGVGLSAAAGTAIILIEAFNRINVSTDDRLRKAELKLEQAQMMLDFQAKTQEDAMTGIASILKETFVVGSVLPDKVG